MADDGRFEFRLPDLGEGIHEAQVLEWMVRAGDVVPAFGLLARVESDKATVELTAPVAGRIAETRVPAGEIARVGEVLVVIETAPGTAASRPDSAAAPAADVAALPRQAAAQGTPPAGAEAAPVPSAPAESGVAAAEPAPREYFGIVGGPPAAPAPLAPAWPPAPPAATASRPVMAAPFVRKLARDLGVRLEDVAGSGPHGRVRVADVEAAAHDRQAPQPSAADAPSGGAAEERVPLRGLRKRIAERMLESVRHAPQVTAIDLFDVTELVQAREQLLPLAAAEGVKLTYLPFVVKAAVEALRRVPQANAMLDEAREEIVLKREYNIGIATAIPEGLVVPVVQHADRRSILEIAAEIARLVDAARARRSPPRDLSGGTFSITSFGGLAGGALYATPILNYPEVAILGIGRIEQQPRVVDGQVVPRHCMGVSLTFDHRVLDGEGGSQFLAALRRCLEHPLALLLHLR